MVFVVSDLFDADRKIPQILKFRRGAQKVWVRLSKKARKKEREVLSPRCTATLSVKLSDSLLKRLTLSLIS